MRGEALAERIKSVAIIKKVDRVLPELQVVEEDLLQPFPRTIVNVINVTFYYAGLVYQTRVPLRSVDMSLFRIHSTTTTLQKLGAYKVRMMGRLWCSSTRRHKIGHQSQPTPLASSSRVRVILDLNFKGFGAVINLKTAVFGLSEGPFPPGR